MHKKCDAKTRNGYLTTNNKPRQSKRDQEKDLKIQQIQDDLEQKTIEFDIYFKNLTHQIMHPYEQDLDIDQEETENLVENEDTTDLEEGNKLR